MVPGSFTILLLQLLSVIYVGGEKLRLTDDGVDFNIKLAPFQVLVTKNPYETNPTFCRGALVRNNSLVTSALCISKISTESKSLLVLNGHATNQSYWVNSTVSEVVLHPKFNQSLTNNNIAVIKLNETFSSKPISYSKNKALKDNTACTAYSYKLSLPAGVVNMNTTCVHMCQKAYNVSKSRYDVNIDTMLCANDLEKKNVICENDVGASLVCDDSLVGLAIYTQECVNKSMSTVYVNIASYAEWIDSTINASSTTSMSTLSVIIGTVISFFITKLLSL